MEKNYTLMKTLTAAFFDLLFSRRKNSRIVNNDRTSTTGGCGNGTTVHDHIKYMNDLDKPGSFLFFEQTVGGQGSAVDSPQSINNEQKIKNKEELKKVNDELAQRNIPKPGYNNWRDRVNDDLAACTAVDDPLLPAKNSYKRKSDNINVDHIFTINHTKTVNNETRTNKNDPDTSGSFCSFIRRNFSEGGLFTNTFIRIIAAFLKSFEQDDLNKNSRLVFIPIRICDKSKMRFHQNRFNQKN